MRWKITDPPLFSIGGIYIKTEGSPYQSSFGLSGITPSVSYARNDFVNVTLKRCEDISVKLLDMLRSYLQRGIPFPNFFLTDEKEKSAICVGDSMQYTRLSKLDTFYSGMNSNDPNYDIEILAPGPLKYIVCPELKIDNLEISLGVVEKLKKSKYIEVSNVTRCIVISRRKNGKNG